MINKIKADAQEYLINQELINRLNKREALYKKLQKSYDERNNDLLVTERILISQEETAGFIFTLEELARQTNNVFEIESVNSFAVDKDSQEKIPFLSLKINLLGDFYNLLDFISNIENNPYPPYRLIEISRINIERLEENDLNNEEEDFNKGDLETSLNLKVYTQ